LNKTLLKYGIIVIASFFIGYNLGTALSSLSELSEYQKKIDSLISQVSSLQEEINEKVSLITDLQSQIVDKYAAIQKAQTQIANLQSQLQEKNRLISSLQDQISDLEAQLDLKILGVYFSPKGRCEEELLYWINRANASIHVLIYSFTLDSLSDALIEAHNRGVDVKVVFEKQQITEHSEYQKLKAAGISVRNDTNSKLMHNKVMIVDGIIVITGSYNYSASAENYNNENMIIILSDYIAGIYEKEFEKIWNQSI